MTRRALLNASVCSLGGCLAVLCGCETTVRQKTAAGYDAWRRLRAAPTARTEVGAAELNGLLYVAGGYLLTGESVATVEAYHISDDSWRRLAPLPAPRNHLTMATAEGRLFAIGGNDGVGGDSEKPSANVWALDPEDGVWKVVSPLPAPRAAHAAVAVENRIYIVGGIGPDPLPTLIYDARRDRWSEGAPIPTERDHLGAALVSNQIVAVAGRSGEAERNVVESYDPITDSWTTLPSLPTARHGLVVAALDNTVHAVCGETFEGKEQTFTTHEALDLDTGVWRTLAPIPTARHGAGGVAYQGRLYVVAGGPEPDLAVTNVTEVYSP